MRAETQETEELIIQIAFDETIAVATYDRWGKIANFSSKGEKVE